MSLAPIDTVLGTGRVRLLEVARLGTPRGKKQSMAKRQAWSASLLVIAVACATEAAAQDIRAAQFNDVFEWVRTVELQQQSPNVVAVRPHVTADPLGGWLVFDAPEGQVRLYGRDGRLKAHFGRRGEGPGEFSTLAGVLRSPSGELITVDMNGRFARWSSDGSALLDEFRVPLRGVSSAEWAGRSSIVVVTPPVFARGNTGPALHIVDIGMEQLQRSFFEPMIPPNARSAWATFVGGGIAVSGDVLGITMPLLDSLLLMSSGASTLSRIPLGLDRDPREIPDGRLDRPAFMRWAARIQVVGPVHATADGWLIPLVRVGRRDGDSADLMFVPRDGGRPVIIHDAPIVVGTDRITGEVVFDDFDQLEPQYVRTARIRLEWQ